jgi:heme exporter protein D
MMRYILIALGTYFGIRFLVGVLVPVIRTALQVKKQFETVRDNSQRFQQQQQQQTQKAAEKDTSYKASKDDYLDFEEIR